MALNSWPFEGQDTTEAQFLRWAAALAGGSGVIDGLEVSPATGLDLSIGLGAAIVQGFYVELVDDPETRSVPAAPGVGQTRRDYMVLRLDLAANQITLEVKPGTANGSGGTLPVLTQTASVWEHPIAVVTVPGGASSLVAGNIVPRNAGLGLRVIPYPSNTVRPDGPAGEVALGINTTTKVPEFWNGTAWENVRIPYVAITDPPTVPPVHALDGAQHSGTLPVSKGGTGATTAAAARAALDVPATAHTHTAAQISDAGTSGRAALQAETLAALREAVGIRVTSTPMTAGTPVGTLRFW